LTSSNFGVRLLPLILEKTLKVEFYWRFRSSIMKNTIKIVKVIFGLGFLFQLVDGVKIEYRPFNESFAGAEVFPWPSDHRMMVAKFKTPDDSVIFVCSWNCMAPSDYVSKLEGATNKDILDEERLALLSEKRLALVSSVLKEAAEKYKPLAFALQEVPEGDKFSKFFKQPLNLLGYNLVTAQTSAGSGFDDSKIFHGLVIFVRPERVGLALPLESSIGEESQGPSQPKPKGKSKNQKRKEALAKQQASRELMASAAPQRLALYRFPCSGLTLVNLHLKQERGLNGSYLQPKFPPAGFFTRSLSTPLIVCGDFNWGNAETLEKWGGQMCQDQMLERVFTGVGTAEDDGIRTCGRWLTDNIFYGGLKLILIFVIGDSRELLESTTFDNKNAPTRTENFCCVGNPQG
jgi:hypothetical protein